MQQQRFEFVEFKISRPRQGWGVSDDQLKHERQVGPTCAYYALAMLKGLPPKTVLQVGQQVLKESRLRKLGGNHNLLVEAYRRLGFRFPWREIDRWEPRRAKTIKLVEFAGSGLVRVTPRPSSNSGHLAAFKAGIVYDSAETGTYTAEEYINLLEKRKRFYVRVIPECYLNRDSDELTDRERNAQEHLKKRPRRSWMW